MSASIVMTAGLVAASGPASGATTDPNRPAGGWFYSTPPQALLDNAARFADASPFWYTAKSATWIANNSYSAKLSWDTQVQTVADLHDRGVLVVPSITDGAGKLVLAKAMSDPAGRTDHVNAIVRLVEEHGFDGIDLDYEGFAFTDGSSSWSTTQPGWIAFVQQLADTLHANGRLLYVTIPWVTGPSTGYWVYSPAQIAASVDRVRVMAYDYSTSSPGPIAPQWWAQKQVDYLASVVPPAKLVLGAPAYGRDWFRADSGTPCPNDSAAKSAMATVARTTTAMAAFAEGRSIMPVRDSASNELTFSYPVTVSGMLAANGTTTPASCTGRRTAWYPDTTSTLGKAGLVSQYQLGGVAVWTVAGADTGLWDALPPLTSSAPTVTLAGTPLAGAVRVTGALANVAEGTTVEVLRDGAPITLGGKNTWTLAAGQPSVLFTVTPITAGEAPDLALRLTPPGGEPVLSNSVSVRAAPAFRAIGEGLVRSVRIRATLTDVPPGSRLTVLWQHAGRTDTILGGRSYDATSLVGNSAAYWTINPVSRGYAPWLAVRLTLPDGSYYTSNWVNPRSR